MNPQQRRSFIELAAYTAIATTLPRWAWAQPRRQQTDPFSMGVASGDPSPDGMVLWTRLAPAEGQATLPLTVQWELADDEGFRRIVQRGQTTALPSLGHSVHVEVAGLAPNRWYHYRFMHGGAVSAIGRTRTAPAADALPERLRVVFASCQRWEHGYYAAWRHVRSDAPDLVLFLGDYIYEYASGIDSTGLARLHGLRQVSTLADLRDRYAMHRSDPDLRAAHAACPWVVTWDDHEVQNDYARNFGRGNPDSFMIQRSAGWQAFYENMPLRASSLLRSDYTAMQVYRRLPWGRLAQFHVLDARQYRSVQACRVPNSGAGPVTAKECAALTDPSRTFLGAAQGQWLDTGLAADAKDDRTRWSVVTQQSLFSPRNVPSGLVSSDTWDGYPAARSRLLQSIVRHSPRNTVFLGGDIHQNYVCRVLADAARPDAPVVASEFCGTSISSRSGTTQDSLNSMMRFNPHVLLARSEQRGYGLADITPTRWTTTLKVLVEPLRADTGISTQARFVVEDRRPGPIAT